MNLATLKSMAFTLIALLISATLGAAALVAVTPFDFATENTVAADADDRNGISAITVAAIPPGSEVWEATPTLGTMGRFIPVSILDPAGSHARALRVGDTLRIVLYERLDPEEDKWGRQPCLTSAYQQRSELSGDYMVAEDGTIAIPLLGSFPVVKRKNDEFEAALAASAEARIGRKGFATVILVERQPVYILGPVKNPGAYKYTPGVTVLHAVALAGGLDRSVVEARQCVELRAIMNGKADTAVKETFTPYEVVRRTPECTTVSISDGTASLEPSDLVQVRALKESDTRSDGADSR